MSPILPIPPIPPILFTIDHEVPMLKYLRFWRYPEYLRLLLYRTMTPALVRGGGVEVGTGVIFWGSPIVSREPDSRIVIGDHSVLCSHAAYTALGVNHPIVLRTLSAGASIRIGAGVRMSGCTLCAARQIDIGARACIGANVTIVDTDFHALDPRDRASPHDADLAVSAPVEIGADVFLGMNSSILKGVRIGEGAVIGAGAVVTKDVPAHAIAAGNPARVIGTVSARQV